LTYFERRVCLDPKQVIALASNALRADVGIIIMVRFVRLQFAAVAMIAAAIIASTTASGWAFTQQMLGPGGNGNYNFNYSDPDHPATSSQSTSPFDSNAPGFHFSIEQGQTAPFSGFQGGNHFDGHSGNATSPEFYIQQQGNGN
jgi:hypothetical protein